MNYYLNNKQFYGVIEAPESMLVYDGETVCGSAENVELPEEYILPDELIPDVRKQYANSCMGHATTGAMQIANYKETGTRTKFSPGFAYAFWRNSVHEGLIPNVALNKCMEMGCCIEEDFPYDYEVPDIIVVANEKVTPELKRRATNFKIKGYVCYALAAKFKNAENIKRALYINRQPIIMITDHYGKNHAVLIIGWNNINKEFIILNSQGKNWGRNGIGDVPYEDCKAAYLIIDAENILDKIPFADVDKADWYFKPIKHCYFANIMKGVSDTEFAPLKATTRAEMAQIIFNLNNKQNNINYGKVEKFKDVESDAWYNNVVAYCTLNGFMVGVSDNEFEPERAMTRAEMAQVFYNMRDRMDIAPTREYIPFNDVSEYAWYYDAVKYCYERELINGTGSGYYESDKEIVRAETAQFMYNYCKAIDKTNRSKYE